MIGKAEEIVHLFRLQQREESLRRKMPGSVERWKRAQQSLAGGVSSGLRRTARPFPLYFSHGCGPYITDVDGNTYVDHMLGWGPLILGHAPREINAAVAEVLHHGLTFGAQHDLEYQVAELLQKFIPCADLVAFANSGTEIVQLALRLARAYTKRPKYLKFEGHYHGWDDSVLVSYHPTLEDIAECAGAPVPTGEGQRAHVDAIVVEWNDRDAVTRVFLEHGDEISAVICEPLLCNSGCIPAEPGFLAFLREITQAHGALLIFDEVITGLRLGLGGAQHCYGVVPDLATFAKAIGGGMPISALAGKRKYMEWIASGKVIHAGTLNGNPVVLAAAKATLETLAANDGEAYRRMWEHGEALRQGVLERLQHRNIPAIATGGGPVFQIHFQQFVPRTYRQTLAADRGLYGDFCVAMLDEGVALLQDGRWYMSAVHTDTEVAHVLAAVDRVLQ